MEKHPMITTVVLNGSKESIHRKKLRERPHVINEVSDGRVGPIVERYIIIMNELEDHWHT